MASYQLIELIEQALKGYRGNEKVIVSVTPGGIIEIEDFDANSLVEENEELEDKIQELEERIEELEEEIEELEESEDE